MNPGTSGRAGAARPAGVRIAGTGVCIPPRPLTNQDIAKRVDTTDAWIRQRTGIHTRYVVDEGVTVRDLARDALAAAITDAGMTGADLDMVIVATITPEMTCPSTAARVAAEVGASPAGAMDLVAACSGFVYALNVASALVETGAYRTVGVVGAETLSKAVNYDDRRTCILFADGAGAAIVTASDEVSQGVLHQSMSSDGNLWGELYLPRNKQHLPTKIDESVVTEPGWNGMYDTLQMDGREVFKFAVLKTEHMIQSSLDAAGITAEDLKLVIPHQSNKRIMSTARERFGLPEEKFYINIDRFGNTSAASVPICLDECRKQGRFSTGDLVLFIAVGGGMTWATSLWRM